MAKNAAPTREPVDPNTIATPSNFITIVRILLVPLFVVILLSPWPEWLGLHFLGDDAKRVLAVIVFIIISCTDWLDGYLARSRNEVTNFGKFMDPLADKILVAGALVALVELGVLPSWVVLIILAREFIVSGVRMMAAKDGVVVAASYWGKFKTVFTMIAIILFTIKDAHMIGDFSAVLADKLYLVSWVVMIIALALTIISMVDYLYKARELFGFGPKKEQGNAGAALDLNAREIATDVIVRASEQGKTIGCAESLTGGLIAGALTAIPGSSSVVNGGIVSYVNDVKNGVLGVDAAILDGEGAVSEACVKQMADGARKALNVDIAVSVSGIAGPTGAEPGKPVGTVYMGVSSETGTTARRFEFEGDRDQVREQTVLVALKALQAELG